MPTTIKQVHQAFELLFSAMCDKSFSKSLYLEHWGEKSLLPLVRTFLLGYFGKSIVPEAQTSLPGNLSGKGRLDFIIDDVAVEFAVRRVNYSANTLSRKINETEVKKLIKHEGKALLVLFDFSSNPLSSEDLETYRDAPLLGQGNHKKTPFQLSYFFKRNNVESGFIKKQIRV